VDLKAVEAEVLALGAALRRRGWRIASAESCTGGLIAAACTSVAGSSDWFECGWVSYSNAAKSALLGVDPALIAVHGAVSEPVVLAMAEGALQRAGVDLAVAVTGIAGPGGGTATKPVGLVWLALAQRAAGTAPPRVRAERLQLGGDRAAIRSASVRRALALLGQAAARGPGG
jgi:nicotinamide-nucleotide amidase